MKNIKIIKPLIPYQFVTFENCIGESNVTWHAGSMHKAMDLAKIQNFNIMKYSSIMPSISEEVDSVPEYPMGTKIEGIIASMDGYRGELLAAGVAYNWLYEDEGLTKKMGGIVVERTGNYTSETLELELDKSLREIKNFSYSNLYWNTDDTVYLKSVFTPEEMYGTAYAGLVFINYIEQ